MLIGFRSDFVCMMPTHILAHKHKYINTHKYTCTHTYTHTHINSNIFKITGKRTDLKCCQVKEGPIQSSVGSCVYNTKK